MHKWKVSGCCHPLDPMKHATLIRLPFIAVLMVGLAACLPSCVLLELNRQTAPHFQKTESKKSK